MLNNTSRKTKLLAAGVGVTLSLALAVSAGAVPRPGDNGSVRTASVSQVEEVAAPAARQPGDTVAAPASVTTTVAAPATTVTTAAAPRTTAPPTTAPRSTGAPVAKVAASPGPAPAATVAPVVTAPAAPVRVARRTPSAAEVQGVIAELKRQVGGLLLLVSPTPAQIDQAADQMCTAFDNNQTFAQVKSTGLSMIPASIVVTDATAGWAVRQGVTLYCPGHASKLV